MFKKFGIFADAAWKYMLQRFSFYLHLVVLPKKESYIRQEFVL